MQAYDDDYPMPYRVEMGDPLARYAIVEGTEVTLRSIGYDHEAAARRADANGSAGWAVALRTGRMA